MGYSEKQKIFAKYMLLQIGILDEDFIEQYLRYLVKLHGKFDLNEWIDKNKFYHCSWRFSVSDCIQALIDEIDLKKDKQNIKKRYNEFQKLSATGLSNYCYCPVSFSISSSFEIEKPSLIELTENGKKLHEELRLTKNYEKIPDDGKCIINQIEYYRQIKSSQLVFVGHNEKEKVFYNESENWNGTPDYVFKDNDGKYFVVEEKFQRFFCPPKEPKYNEYTEEYDYTKINEYNIWAEKDVWFFDNHVVQTFSYVRNIKDYKIEYGFLIYWYYWYDGDNTYIHRVAIKKIIQDKELEGLYLENKNGIQNLKDKGFKDFASVKITPNKCAACVVTKYCSHKTNRFDKFFFPYNLDQINLYQAEFPNMLKKRSENKYSPKQQQNGGIDVNYEYFDSNKINNRSGLSPDEEREILNSLFR